MDRKYSYSNISKSEINFMINEGTIILNFKDGKQKKNFKNKPNKGKLPKNKIFHINSLIYNKEKQINEIYNTYDCIYNEIDNSLYLIINENDNYSKFTKDKLINILEFSISLGIDKICLLISKSNNQFLNIIQDMMIVGFKSEKNYKKINIDENEYKILKMSIKDMYQEIKEITLI